MRKFFAFAIGVLTIALMTCSPTVSPPPAPAATAALAKSGTFRIAGASSNISSIPLLMTVDALRQQGYTVELVPLRFDLAIPALAKGDVDIVVASHQLAWTAIAKDAPIHTIVSWTSDQFMVVVKAEIQACANLQGKVIANGSLTAVNTSLFEQYLRKNCAGTSPQSLVIPSSTNRVAALIASQIDGALLETDDWIQLQRQVPGRFRILNRFRDEFPKIEIGGYAVRNDFAAAHPEMVHDFVRTLVQAYRRVQDKQVLRDNIAKYLPGDAAALEAADIYLEQKAWNPNGGLTPETVQATLDFLIQAQAIPSGVKATQVVDLSYLNAVLNELGRK